MKNNRTSNDALKSLGGEEVDIYEKRLSMSKQNKKPKQVEVVGETLTDRIAYCLYRTAEKYLTDLPKITREQIPQRYQRMLFNVKTVIYSKTPKVIASVYDDYPDIGLLQYVMGGDGMEGIHRTFLTVHDKEVVIGFIPKESCIDMIDADEYEISTLRELAKENTMLLVSPEYYDTMDTTDEEDLTELAGGVYEYFKRMFKHFNLLTAEQKYYIKSDLTGAILTKDNKLTHKDMIDFVKIFSFKYEVPGDVLEVKPLTASEVSEESRKTNIDF